MLRYILTSLICAIPLVISAQVERQKAFSLEAAIGLTNLEDFKMKSSAGLTAQVRVKPRFIISLVYERFQYRLLYERAADADESGAVSYVYDQSNSLGIYSGMDFLVRRRIILSLIAGPTISNFEGERWYACGFDSCNRNEYSQVKIGIGATLKGEFSFTRNLYGLTQFNVHESIANHWTRLGFRVGAGLRI